MGEACAREGPPADSRAGPRASLPGRGLRGCGRKLLRIRGERRFRLLRGRWQWPRGICNVQCAYLCLCIASWYFEAQCIRVGPNTLREIGLGLWRGGCWWLVLWKSRRRTKRNSRRRWFYPRNCGCLHLCGCWWWRLFRRCRLLRPRNCGRLRPRPRNCGCFVLRPRNCRCCWFPPSRPWLFPPLVPITIPPHVAPTRVLVIRSPVPVPTVVPTVVRVVSVSHGWDVDVHTRSNVRSDPGAILWHQAGDGCIGRLEQRCHPRLREALAPTRLRGAEDVPKRRKYGDVPNRRDVVEAHPALLLAPPPRGPAH